jgi:hypothetical protein
LHLRLPHALPVIPLFLSSVMAAATPPPAALEAEIDYPATRRGDVVDDLFGEQIPDPYRWLENDARGDDEVAAWVQAQNEVTEAYLTSLPERDIFQEQRRPADDVEVRLHAAAAGSVIRVLNEEIGGAVLAGVDRASLGTSLQRIACAVRVATDGVVGDPVASRQGSTA